MARAKNDSNENDQHAGDIDLADSCLAKFFENDKVDSNDLFTNNNLSQSISKSNLIAAQHKEPEISTLFEKAVEKCELSNDSVCYFVQNDILMRKFCPNRKFSPNFSSVCEPMTALLKKNATFTWTKDCDTAFEKVKAMLVSTPVLSAPSFDHPFKLAVDASDVAVGAVLLQEVSDGIDHTVLLLFSQAGQESTQLFNDRERMFGFDTSSTAF